MFDCQLLICVNFNKEDKDYVYLTDSDKEFQKHIKS